MDHSPDLEKPPGGRERTMNWVKENKFLTGFIVVMLIGLGARWATEASIPRMRLTMKRPISIHRTTACIHRLRHLVPFPNKQNLEAYDVQKEEAAKVITAFEADLSKKEFPARADFPE